MKNKNNETIGQVVDRKVKKYIELFEKFRKDKIIEIRNKAESLALHDLIQAKIINRMALEQLEKYIAKTKSKECEK